MKSGKRDAGEQCQLGRAGKDVSESVSQSVPSITFYSIIPLYLYVEPTSVFLVLPQVSPLPNKIRKYPLSPFPNKFIDHLFVS